jgi:AraC-like DNA-binding protein
VLADAPPPPRTALASEPAPVHARHRELAEAARVLLCRQLDRAHDLAGLAVALGCSPFHLARVFRAVTGAPLHRTLLSLRLRAALEPLAEGATDLTALALSLGFSSHAHFSTCFRRAFGTTPSAFRASFTRASLTHLQRN